MNGPGGPGGMPWYQAAGLVVAGIAVMGVAGWMMGPQRDTRGTRGGQAPKRRTSPEGIRIVPKEGNFVLRPGDVEEESDEDPVLEEMSKFKSKLDDCVEKGDFMTAQMIVAAMERLALESWGEDAWQRGLALIPVARFYEATNKALYVPTLEESARILKAHGHPTLVLVCGKLRHAYAEEDPVRSFEWAMEAEKIQEKVLETVPSPENMITYAVVCSNLSASAFVCGYFKETTVPIYPESFLTFSKKWRHVSKGLFFKYFPLSHDCMRSVESWSNSYFLQGTTFISIKIIPLGEREEALQILKEYLQLIASRKDPKTTRLHPVESYILFLGLDMAFMCELFEEALYFAEKLLESIDDPDFEVQSLCDMITIYKELGEEALALEAEKRILERPQQVKVAARSRYFTTLTCGLNKDHYTMHIKVNQGPCPRKEGERYKPHDNDARLLKDFFIVATFENIGDPKGEPLVIEMEVHEPEFTIKSPATGKIPAIDKYYHGNISIYENDSKEKQIGQHYQLFLCDLIDR